MNPTSDNAGGESVLAIHSGALGDVVLFGRLLACLGGRVTLVAGGQKARLLRDAGVAAGAIDFDSLPMHEIFTDEPLERCALPGRLGRHGRLVSCFAGDDARAAQRLAAMCSAATASMLPVRPPAGFRGHLLELWGDLLGVRIDLSAQAAWPVADAWRAQAREALRGAGIDVGKPYLAIHPGSGGREKCWPLDRFRELARRAGGQCLFLLGPAECDRWPVREIESLGREFPTLANPSLDALAGVLAGAAAYAGNDSGVSHLAAAVGTRTLALFGPSRADHFAPVGPAVTVLARDRFETLAVSDVLSALETLR